MIDYASYRRIHHLSESEKLNVAQIARRLALDPRTVRDWLDEPTFPAAPDGAAAKQARSLQARHPAMARTVSVQRHADLPAPAASRLPGRHQHRAGVRATGAAAPGAGLPDPALRTRRVRPGGLGPLRIGQRRQHAPTTELLRPGALLQPHDVRRVHRLADHGTLPRLPCERLRGARRGGAGADHGRQPEVRGVATPERRGAGVQSPLCRLRPPLRLYDRTLQRRRRPREGARRGWRRLRQEEPTGRSGDHRLQPHQSDRPAMARRDRQCAHTRRDTPAPGRDVRGGTTPVATATGGGP